MKSRLCGSDRNQGASLVEVAVYMSVLGVMATPIMAISLQVSRSAQEAELVARVVERNGTILERIEDDFRDSIAGSGVVSSDGKTITFNIGGAFDGSDYTTGDSIRYQVLGSSSASSDSAQNTIRRSNLSTGEQITIGSYVDTDECGFALQGNGMVATVTTVGIHHRAGVDTRMTQTIIVFPRND